LLARIDGSSQFSLHTSEQKQELEEKEKGKRLKGNEMRSVKGEAYLVRIDGSSQFSTELGRGGGVRTKWWDAYVMISCETEWSGVSQSAPL
jgi:hypothetical protein